MYVQSSMNDSLVKLDDLPDEILMHIFKKLNNIDVIYTLTDVNQRFNRIARDPIFTSYLPLLLYFPNDSIDPLPHSMLDRFCSKILPEIGHQVKSLYLERTSMERILLTTNYPNLSHLHLYDIDIKIATSFFNHENPLANTLKNQISSLFIKFYEKDQTSNDNVHTFIFTQILIIFTNLRCFNFNPPFLWNRALCFDMSPLTISSSILLELHVVVDGVSDCFDLLDGRFEQLHALYIIIELIDNSPFPFTNKDEKKLSNLKVFSLYCQSLAYSYQISIVPLLQLMLNLEELDITIIDALIDKCIDGDTLMNDIIIHMPQLNKFTFNIYSNIRHDLQGIEINLLSKEYIQQTFEDFYNNEIITCVDHFQEKRFSQYHIYSYPYKLTFYNNITNNFPGGLFNSVKEVSLYDERPFEYEFFLRIARSFPFVKHLTINNPKAQNDKQFIKSENENETLSIIEYPNLTTLDFLQCHDDYLELFLLHTKVSLPNNVHLCVDYQSLKSVTYNFTRNITRINCAKIGSLYLFMEHKADQHVKDYFSHIYIL